MTITDAGEMVDRQVQRCHSVGYKMNASIAGSFKRQERKEMSTKGVSQVLMRSAWLLGIIVLTVSAALAADENKTEPVEPAREAKATPAAVEKAESSSPAGDKGKTIAAQAVARAEQHAGGAPSSRLRGILSGEPAERIHSIILACLQKDVETWKSKARLFRERTELSVTLDGQRYQCVLCKNLSAFRSEKGEVNVVGRLHVKTVDPWTTADGAVLPGDTYIVYENGKCEVFGAEEKKILDLNAELFKDYCKKIDEWKREALAEPDTRHIGARQAIEDEIKALAGTIKRKRRDREKTIKDAKKFNAASSDRKIIRIEFNYGIGDDKKALAKAKRKRAALVRIIRAEKERKVSREVGRRITLLREALRANRLAVIEGTARTEAQMRERYEKGAVGLEAAPARP